VLFAYSLQLGGQVLAMFGLVRVFGVNASYDPEYAKKKFDETGEFVS
jgi:hypothetical protein